MRNWVKSILYIFIFLISEFLIAQNDIASDLQQFAVTECDNISFRNDKFWRGADGAAAIDLENGKILWLFSDTFIDTDGTGNRINSKMINNTIAIQDGNDILNSNISFSGKAKLKNRKHFLNFREKPGFGQDMEPW